MQVHRLMCSPATVLKAVPPLNTTRAGCRGCCCCCCAGGGGLYTSAAERLPLAAGEAPFWLLVPLALLCRGRCW